MKSEPDFPNIDNCNPLTCISGKILKCQRVISGIYRKHLQPFEITSSQLSILFICTKLENVNQAKLSKILKLEKSTVSRNIKRLLDRKLIKKEKGQVMTITHVGKLLLEQIIPEWDKAKIEAKKALKKEGEAALDLLLTNLS